MAPKYKYILTKRWFRAVCFIAISVLVYIGIISVFALWYLNTNSIYYSGQIQKPVNNFEDCFYFSLVTFQTIGYGDIYPALPIAKSILKYESITSTLFMIFFSSTLTYIFLKRTNDIFMSDNFFVRFSNNKYLLSIRIGNMGKEIIDCKIMLDILEVNSKKIRTRRVSLKKEFAIMEKTWYADFEMYPDASGDKLLKQIQRISNYGDNLSIRIILTGTDIRTNTSISIVKYYKKDKLIYGGDFEHVFLWDKEKLTRTQLNWEKF